MTTIQTPPSGAVAPGAAELEATRRSSAPASSRSLSDVILLAGIASAKNNELRLKACYQEVLAMARWMENLRKAKTAISNHGSLGYPQYVGYTQFGPDGKPLIDGAGWPKYGPEPSPQPSTCTRTDRYGNERTYTRSKEYQAYLEAKQKDPNDPNLKQLWNDHLRHLGYNKDNNEYLYKKPGEYPGGYVDVDKTWEQAAMENDPAGYLSRPTFEITNPETGQIGHAQLSDYIWGPPCHSCAGSVEDQCKALDEAIQNYSTKQQIAMQDLQAAVSKQNELNQLISQNMSKLHEISQTAVSKMG